jgi:hypothetical protein
MIDSLDRILRRLLTDAVGEAFDPPTTGPIRPPAVVNFVPPDAALSPRQAEGPVLNVYLAEVRENRTLRRNDLAQFQGRDRTEARAPARIDCTYLISAWSPEGGNDAEAAVAVEHRLLYGAAAALLRREPIVAREVFDIPDGLDDLHDNHRAEFDASPFAQDPAILDFYALDPILRDMELPTDVLPPEGFARLADFWGLMGAGAVWRPVAEVVVTLPVERTRRLVGEPVRSIGTTYGRRGVPRAPETLFHLAGQLFRDTDPRAVVPRATVRLERVEDDGRRSLVGVETTDGLGRFVFSGLRAAGHVLGAGGVEKAVEVPPASLEEYDFILH